MSEAGYQLQQRICSEHLSRRLLLDSYRGLRKMPTVRSRLHQMLAGRPHKPNKRTILHSLRHKLLAFTV